MSVVNAHLCLGMYSILQMIKSGDLNRYLSDRMDRMPHPDGNKILERIMAKSPRIKGATPGTIQKILQDIKALITEGGHSFEDIANIVVNSIEQYPDVYGVTRRGSYVNTRIVTALDLPWALITQTMNLPPQAEAVLEKLKDKDLSLVNMLIKRIPATMQFIREVSPRGQALSNEQIAERLYTAFHPDVKKSHINYRLIRAEDMINPAEKSDALYSTIDKLKQLNAAKPSIVAALETMKQHMAANKMTADEVKRLLKYEVVRHPEWNINID